MNNDNKPRDPRKASDAELQQVLQGLAKIMREDFNAEAIFITVMRNGAVFNGSMGDGKITGGEILKRLKALVAKFEESMEGAGKGNFHA